MSITFIFSGIFLFSVQIDSSDNFLRNQQPIPQIYFTISITPQANLAPELPVG